LVAGLLLERRQIVIRESVSVFVALFGYTEGWEFVEKLSDKQVIVRSRHPLRALVCQDPVVRL
jgi:hypothetical protein